MFFELCFLTKVNTLDLITDFLKIYLYFIKYAECVRDNRSFRNISRISQNLLSHSRGDR